jgi:hypothetical protein
LGEDAICPLCVGTNRVVYVSDDDGETFRAEPFDARRHPWAKRGWTCECDQGYRQLPYARFAAEYVNHWGKEWTMSRDSILEWLTSTSRTERVRGADEEDEA